MKYVYNEQDQEYTVTDLVTVNGIEQGIDCLAIGYGASKEEAYNDLLDDKDCLINAAEFVVRRCCIEGCTEENVAPFPVGRIRKEGK